MVSVAGLFLFVENAFETVLSRFFLSIGQQPHQLIGDAQAVDNHGGHATVKGDRDLGRSGDRRSRLRAESRHATSRVSATTESRDPCSCRKWVRSLDGIAETAVAFV
jgi:hypothetical protein